MSLLGASSLLLSLCNQPLGRAVFPEVSGEVVRMAWQSTVAPTAEMPHGQIRREAREEIQQGKET